MPHKYTEAKSLTVKGGCFTEEKTFAILEDRLNVVFGHNGSGKSSIARAIAQYGTGGSEFSTVSFDVEPLDRDRIFVFNERFIDEKMRIVEGGGRREKLGAIVMYGKQIQDDEELDQAELDLDDARNALENAKSDSQSLSSEIGAIESKLEKELKRDDSYSGLMLAFNRIDNPSRKNKPSVDMASVASSPTAVWQGMPMDQDGLSSYIKRKTVELSGMSAFKSIVWNSPTVDAGFDVDRVNALLEKSVVSGELTDRDRLLLSSLQSLGLSLAGYADDAKKLFSSPGEHVCPLCQRPMTSAETDSLFADIERQFGKAADNFKNELHEAWYGIRDLDVVFPEVPDSLKNKILACESAVKDLNAMRRDAAGLLADKARHIDSAAGKTIDPVAVATRVSGCRIAFDELQKGIDSHNEAVLKVSGEKDKLQVAIRYYAFVQNKGDFNQLDGKRMALGAIDIPGLERRYNALDAKVRSLKARTRPENYDLARTFINNCLEMVFGSSNRISLAPADKGYGLVVKGSRGVLPCQVSAGERNILALAYFFASVMEGAEEGRETDEPAFIVIDDPVSSFDADNRIGVMSLLKWLIFQTLRGNSDRKMLILSHDMSTVIDLTKLEKTLPNSIHRQDAALYYELSDKGVVSYYATNEFYDSNQGHKVKDRSRKVMKDYSEYQKMLDAVYEFAAQEEPEESFQIGNTMRRVAEAYSSFVYRIGFKDMMVDNDIIGRLPSWLYQKVKNRMVGILFDEESHSEDSVFALKTGERSFSPFEMRETARYLLCFLYHINEQHVVKYLSHRGENDRIERIKDWKRQFETRV